MTNEIEIKVMKILNMVDFDSRQAIRKIEEMGNEAVTVLCEVALGNYPNIRRKVQTNAVALLGWSKHPQALETIKMLVTDPKPGVSIRAIRSAGRQKVEGAVDDLGYILSKRETSSIIAEEAVKALMAINSPKARKYLKSYSASDSKQYPHRGTIATRDLLKKSQE